MFTDDNEDGILQNLKELKFKQSRKDEGSYLIRKLNIKDVLEKIPEKDNVGVSDAEVKDMMTKIKKRNAIQGTDYCTSYI